MIAAGLFYLAELVEEYTVMTKRILTQAHIVRPLFSFTSLWPPFSALTLCVCKDRRSTQYAALRERGRERENHAQWVITSITEALQPDVAFPPYVSVHSFSSASWRSRLCLSHLLHTLRYQNRAAENLDLFPDFCEPASHPVPVLFAI